MKQAGEREREGKRKTQSDTMLENRGKVVPLQPSKTHSCNTSPTLRQAVREPSVLVPGLFTARLDSATLQDDTIRDDRVAPCLGGSMVRRTLAEKLPIVGKNFNVGGLENLSLPDGYRYYRSDFAILEVENEEGSNRLSLRRGCLPRYLVPGVAKLRNVASPVKYHLPWKRTGAQITRLSFT
ncbi:hypothetical protein K0M31_009456 [Melipona bicolor]|uniref:Uncharacterized protein n=1 Tax=Melipona bicolor TaxID=60889 RepID=A0AA40FN92_9HYME|nr:hypothetical protein K0M31_009456 [Melipona bicolor]